MAQEESPDPSSKVRGVSRTQRTVRVSDGGGVFFLNSRRLSLHSLLTPEVLL